VTVGSRVTIDIAMQVSPFEDEVVVTAESPMIEVASAGVTASVSDTAIANLPLDGRDFGELVLLTPGAVAGRGTNRSNKEVRGATGGVNIGARSVQNSFNIDGATAQSSFFGNERGGGFTPFIFSQAAIEEFQVIRSSSNMRFAAGGGVINAITKSGSNQLHGEVFGYYRNDSLVEANALGERADDFDQIQYGLTLGGPVVRDRLHYFVSYDAEAKETPSFHAFERFPAGREDDWETVTGLDWENETGVIMGINDTHVVLLKLDWQLGGDHLLSARYNTVAVGEGSNLFPTERTSGWSRNGTYEESYDSLVTSLNSVLADSLFNEAFVHYSLERRPQSANVTSLPETRIQRGWWGAFGQGYWLPNDLEERRWQVVDNLGSYFGKHTLGAGINLDFVTFEDSFMQLNGGRYEYWSWEDLLDGGEPDDYTQAFSESGGRVVYDTDLYAAYLQDEWRPSPNLTVSLGVRYDYQRHDQPR